MSIDSQLSAIDSRKRWRGALLTSYTLSLTYFEGYVLPKLLAADCEQIIVLVDVDGYRSSLMEMRSRRVGTDYRLVPVQLSGGIFHPKLTYLWGVEQDLLMVGSGNITFGGHGRNIEVLDVLSSDRHPAAFADFGAFLDRLVVSDRVTLPETDGLLGFAARARSFRGDDKTDADVRLLHCINIPMLDQWIHQAQVHGPYRRLLALSPFHHPTAEPIYRIVRDLQLRELHVGVPSGGQPSAFPFHVAKRWGIKVLPVAPDVDNVNRRLHAKWFELSGPNGCLSLTGSVNATKKSLASIDNIEVAVLRRGRMSSTKFVSAKPPTYAPDEYLISNTVSTLPIYASIGASGMLHGRVLGAGDLEGGWEAIASRGDEVCASTQIIVDRDGRFDWVLPLEEARSSSSLQIQLRNRSRRARGWVSSEAELAMSNGARAALRAMQRMWTGSESLDDITALLAYIANEASQLSLNTAAAGSSSSEADITATPSPGEQAAPSAAVSFSTVDLDLSSMDPAHLFQAFSAGSSGGTGALQKLSIMARLLSGVNSPRSAISTHSDDGDDARSDDHGPAQRGSEAAHTQWNLDQFAEQMAQAATACTDPKRRAKILLIWLSATLRLLVGRRRNPIQARAAASTWLRRVSYHAGTDSLLDETVAGVTAVLASGENDLMSLNSQLESYYSGDVPYDGVIEAARRWLGQAIPNALVGGHVESAVMSLKTTLATTTRRSIMASIAEGRKRPSDFNPGTFTNSELKWLRNALSRPKQKFFLVRHRTEKACPVCGANLDIGEVALLATRRLLECRNCSRPLISLEA